MATLPLVALTTLATVIASQAVISGAFSLTRQAVQLGYLPRLEVRQTSTTHIGQIYIPALNWVLMIAAIGLVVGFRTSSRLAAAYGVAVTTDMVFTTILFAVVARQRFRWALPGVVALAATFLVVDLGFWSASLLKIPSGGWFPLVIAAVVFTVMTTWITGRRILADRIAEVTMLLPRVLEEIVATPLMRASGTAVYLVRNTNVVPHALLQNLRHNKVLHERIVLLALRTNATPRVSGADRVHLETLAPNVFSVVAHFGFTEVTEVPELLDRLRNDGLDIDPAQSTFFLSRETLLATNRPGMALWRERLFGLLARNARRATKVFNLPSDRVFELGSQIEL